MTKTARLANAHDLADPFSRWPAELDGEILATIAWLDEEIEAIAETTSSVIGAEIGEYRAGEPGSLLGEVRGVTRVNLKLLVKVLGERRMPMPQELTFLTELVGVRVRQGLSMVSVLRAYRVGHRITWNAIIDRTEERPDGQRVAIAMARPCMDFIDILLTGVAETYLEAAGSASLADHDAEVRELVESVIAGREPTTRNEAALTALDSLRGESGFLVLRGRFGGDGRAPGRALRRASAAIGQIGVSGGRTGLVIPYRGGIVGFLELDDEGPRTVCEHLERMYKAIEIETGGPLLIGTSLECGTLSEASRALTESEEALALATPERPVVSLTLSSMFDHMLSRGDDSLTKIAANTIARLDEGDERGRGELKETVLAFAAADQSARRAAEKLHCHPNTVHYRIRKVRESTGLDPNSFTDLMDLVAAIRLDSLN